MLHLIKVLLITAKIARKIYTNETDIANLLNIITLDMVFISYLSSYISSIDHGEQILDEFHSVNKSELEFNKYQI